MGFRFYRRIKMGGGLGLNLGKRGISWSVRGKGGSFGSRGFSVRTGLKGLSYQQRFKNRSNNSTYYPRQRFSRADRNYANSIIFIGFIILLFIFNISSEILILLSLIFVGSKVFKYYRKRAKVKKIIEPTKSVNSITAFPEIEENILQNQYLVKEEVKNLKDRMDNYYSHLKESDLDKEISLEFSHLITLENICIEFVDLVNHIIVERKFNSNLLKRYSDTEIKLLLLHDICNIFHLFEISIDNKSKERQLWYSTIFYFTNNSTNFTYIQETEIKKTIQNLIRPDFFVFPDIEKFPFTALIELKKHNSELYKSYKIKLRTYTSLIATIDFKLTSQEKKLIEIINIL